MDTMLDTNANATKNAKRKKNELPAMDASSLNGIVQIRDILLGDQISSWESRIAKMEEGIQEFIKRTDAQITALNNRMDKFISTAENRLGGMDEQLKTLTEKTESRLAAMDERIAQADKELKEELETNLMDLEQENTDLRMLVDNFKEEFEQALRVTLEGKVDRVALAEALAGLASALSGGTSQ